MYQATSRKLRASNYRRDARACELAGYPDFAAVNWEMAELLDPAPRERVTREAPRAKRPSKGPDHSRVGGQRDAAPRRAA